MAAVLQPAGVEKSIGIISAAYIKDPTDSQWQNDQSHRDWLAWMKKYNRDADIADRFNVYGYSAAQALVQVLQQCGDDLTRENVMRQAEDLRDLQLPMMLPGILISTSPSNFHPIRQMQLQRRAMDLAVLLANRVAHTMRSIRTDLVAKENTQGRHYMPKSLFANMQVLDPTHQRLPRNSQTDPQLRKLG